MKSLETTNLITIVDDDILVNGYLFPFQSQWNYDHTIYVSNIVTTTKVVGIASWCFYALGSICEGITIDGIQYAFHINFHTASNHRYQLFLAFLNGLGKGTFSYYDHHPPLAERSVCIRLVCGDNNGLQYDLLWSSFNEIETVKSTCEIQVETKDCCLPYGKYYVIIIDGVEYSIPEDHVAICNMINDEFLGQPIYKEKVASEWPDKEDCNMLHPDPCKILERANRVIDPKIR